MPLENLVLSLRALPESAPRDAYLQFLNTAGDASLRRDGGPEHVTASCFAFSPDFDHVLLCFHRKGQFWVQFGGHLEPNDATVAEAAQREAREESGISDLTLLSPATSPVTSPAPSPAPAPVLMDLDRHDLHGGFSCSAHWDVGFAAVVSPDAVISVSDESEAVRWFPVSGLPEQVPSGFGARLAHVRRAALSLPGVRAGK